MRAEPIHLDAVDVGNIDGAIFGDHVVIGDLAFSDDTKRKHVPSPHGFVFVGGAESNLRIVGSRTAVQAEESAPETSDDYGARNRRLHLIGTNAHR